MRDEDDSTLDGGCVGILGVVRWEYPMDGLEMGLDLGWTWVGLGLAGVGRRKLDTVRMSAGRVWAGWCGGGSGLRFGYLRAGTADMDETVNAKRVQEGS